MFILKEKEKEKEQKEIKKIDQKKSHSFEDKSIKAIFCSMAVAFGLFFAIGDFHKEVIKPKMENKNVLYQEYLKEYKNSNDYRQDIELYDEINKNFYNNMTLKDNILFENKNISLRSEIAGNFEGKYANEDVLKYIVNLDIVNYLAKEFFILKKQTNYNKISAVKYNDNVLMLYLLLNSNNKMVMSADSLFSMSFNASYLNELKDKLSEEDNIALNDLFKMNKSFEKERLIKEDVTRMTSIIYDIIYDDNTFKVRNKGFDDLVMIANSKYAQSLPQLMSTDQNYINESMFSNTLKDINVKEDNKKSLEKAKEINQKIDALNDILIY